MDQSPLSPDDLAIWERLLAEQPIPDVKASPTGIVTHTGGAYRIFVARHAGAPVALAALEETRTPWRQLHARCLASAGDVHWRAGYPITGRDVATAIAALLDTLNRLGGWDVLALGPMLADGPALAALLGAGNERHMRPIVDAAGAAPRVVFEGSWDAYYAGLSGNLRSVVSRGERHLQKHGELVLEEHRGAPSLDRALEEFFAIEASGWKGHEGSAIAVEPGLHARYLALAHEAAVRDRFRLYLLRAGTTLVAGDYAIEHDGSIYMLKTGYGGTFAKSSPGQVLHKWVLSRLWSSASVRSFDFMPGGGEHADYKYRWANETRSYATVRLFHPYSPRGQALAGLIKLKHRADARRRAAPHAPA